MKAIHYLVIAVILCLAWYLSAQEESTTSGATVIWLGENHDPEKQRQIAGYLLFKKALKRKNTLENLEMAVGQLSPTLRKSYDEIIIDDTLKGYGGNPQLLAICDYTTIYIKSSTLLKNPWVVAHEAQHAFETWPEGHRVQQNWSRIPGWGITAYSQSVPSEDSAEWVRAVLQRANGKKSPLDWIPLDLLRDPNTPYGKNLKLLVDSGSITGEQYLKAIYRW